MERLQRTNARLPVWVLAELPTIPGIPQHVQLESHRQRFAIVELDGDAIREKLAGADLREVSAASGVHIRTLQRIVRDGQAPQLRTAQKLAPVLGLPVPGYPGGFQPSPATLTGVAVVADANAGHAGYGEFSEAALGLELQPDAKAELELSGRPEMQDALAEADALQLEAEALFRAKGWLDLPWPKRPITAAHVRKWRHRARAARLDRNGPPQ